MSVDGGTEITEKRWAEMSPAERFDASYAASRYPRGKNPYKQVTWFADGHAPHNAILIQKTRTGPPGAYYVLQHPNVLARLYYAAKRSIHSWRL